MKKIKSLIIFFFILFPILLKAQAPNIVVYNSYLNNTIEDNVSINTQLTFHFEVNDDSKIDNVTIDFGDGNNNSIICDNQTCSDNFTHTYTSSGAFNVILTVYDDEGNSNTQTKLIRVYANDEYYVANWGTDSNTCQSPGEPCRTISYVIYNRMGDHAKIFIIPKNDNNTPDLTEDVVINKKNITITTEPGAKRIAVIKAVKDTDTIFQIQASNIIIKNLKIYAAEINLDNGKPESYSGGSKGIYIKVVGNLDNITLQNLIIGWSSSDKFYVVKEGIYLKNNNFTTLSNLLIDNISVYTYHNDKSYPIFGGIDIVPHYESSAGNVGGQNYNNLTIQNSIFSGYGSVQIHFYPGANNIKFINNTLPWIFLRSPSTHSYFKNLYFKNNKFVNCPYCIQNICGDMYDIIIDNNTFTNFNWAIFIGRKDTWGSCDNGIGTSDNITISNNIIKNAGSVGIGINKLTNSKIINNEVDNSSGPNIKLESSSYNLIKGNIIKISRGIGYTVGSEGIDNSENNKGGLDLYNSSYNIVVDNYFEDNTPYNIILTNNSHYNTVYNNEFHQNVVARNLRTLFNSYSNLILDNNFYGPNEWGFIEINDNYNTIFYNNCEIGCFSGATNNSNFWNSPVKLFYKYLGYDEKNPVVIKNFIGNFHGDITENVDNTKDGINDEKYQERTYNNKNVPNNFDYAPLSDDNLTKYEILMWFFGNDNKLYKMSITKYKDIIIPSDNGSILWIYDSSENIDFDNGTEVDGTTWTGQILFKQALKEGQKIKIEIGTINNNIFQPHVESVVTGDGISSIYSFVTNAKKFSIDNNDKLCVKLTNLSSDNVTLVSGGGYNFISPPVDKEDYILKVNIKKYGRVVSFPEGIDYTCDTDKCYGNNTASFFLNSSVKLMAIDSNDNYTISSWSYNCDVDKDNNSICYVDINDNYTEVTAIFDYVSFKIETEVVGNGTIYSSDNLSSVKFGTPVQIDFKADKGNYIDELYVDNNKIDNATGKEEYTYTFDNVTSNHKIKIIFKKYQFKITVQKEGNGKITPSTDQTLYYGDNVTFKINADIGYHIEKLIIDNKTIDNATNLDNYTVKFDNVTSNHSISVSFAKNIYRITINIEKEYADITPSDNFTVEYGDDAQITINTHEGYLIKEIYVDNKSIDNVYGKNSYTYVFNNVTSNHNLVVTLEKLKYKITVIPPENGKIIPSESQIVNYRDNFTFQIVADDCYEISEIIVDGETVKSYGTSSHVKKVDYTIDNITSNHTIKAKFKKGTYKIYNKSYNFKHGMVIPPDITKEVEACSSQQYQIIADKDYVIKMLRVSYYINNNSTFKYFDDAIGKENYTLNLDNISSDIVITVSYSLKTYTITVEDGDNGTIIPSDNQTVEIGDNITFSILADEGFYIEKLLVDNTSIDEAIGLDNFTYTFDNVSENHSIKATFAPKKYNIIVDFTSNGKVIPSDNRTVFYGTSLIFNITANEGYVIKQLLDNDKVIEDALGTEEYKYKLNNIKSDHHIKIIFGLPCKVTVKVGDNGNVEPSGDITVGCGTSKLFKIRANEGYYIDNLTVDGKEDNETKKAIGKKYYELTLKNITSPHIIQVSFRMSEKFPLILKSGWNLIALPGEEDLKLDKKFEKDKVTIWKWKNNKWMVYSNIPFVKELIDEFGLDKIDTIEIGEGFWINIEFDSLIEFYPINNYSIETLKALVKEGWNLLGIGKNITVNDLKNSLNGLKHIWKWKDNVWYFYTPDENLKKIIEESYIKYIFQDLKELKRGDGFWIFIGKE